MKIAIIGTGNVGGALAKKWAASSHEVKLGVRNTEDFKGKELLSLSGVSAATVADAVAASEIILVSTPAMAAVEVTKSRGDTTGKIIIDAMNIVGGRGPEGFSSTADAILAHTATRDVVKCFNSTGFNNMENTRYGDLVLDMYMAGESAGAKAKVRQLALDAGFAECYDIGGNDKFHLLEQFAIFWINLAMVRGYGREIGFKLLKR